MAMQPHQERDVRDQALEADIETACKRIAPTWPLDQFIAVNPYWGFVEQPIEAASAQLARLSGTRLLMDRAYYREKWQRGELGPAHLQRAIAEKSASWTPDQLIAGLDDSDTAPATRSLLVSDRVDAQRDLRHAMPWRDFIAHQISQHCAAHFDRHQAAWGPDRSAGLYPTWRERAFDDRSPLLLMGLKYFGDTVRALPTEPRALIAAATQALGIPATRLEAYFTGLLLSVNGWAAWCAYERWQARLAQGDDDQIVHLLAIRLAWELVLFRVPAFAVAKLRLDGWPESPTLPLEEQVAQEQDWLLQRALEIAYQEPLLRGLISGLDAQPQQAVAVQAVFCIDVRSEIFRRALESSSPHVQTLGFAGFFGLPISYSPIGTSMTRPQLPGLLAPAQTVSDAAGSASLGEAIARQRKQGLQWRRRWQEFRSSASSGFTFVESCGLLYAGKLVQSTLASEGDARPMEQTGLSAHQRASLRPVLPTGHDAFEARCDLAAGVLGAMGLRRNFARLVLLAGHGSQSANNPHASGLDCGACGGQTGEVNARVLAGLLNEPDVRAGLLTRGFDVPDRTQFVAGLHNTTTDEVTLYDLDRLSATHQDDLKRLRAWLGSAGDTARAERAASLGLADQRHDATGLKRAVRIRANDWAQVRPEWGLANNAAFIVAPRERTRHLDLGGRAFLHDYRWQDDAGFKVLELIMTAPMLVTNWINLQYYASTVDNRRYGSGNKVLHNVVGGRLGVFEGNGGDLRIGLPWQSLHDGERLLHTPLRLSVFIEAPQAAISAIIGQHEIVRQLVQNEWLHLFRLDSEQRTVSAYRRSDWAVTIPASDGQASAGHALARQSEAA